MRSLDLSDLPPSELAPSERLALLPAPERKIILAALNEAQAEALRWDWRFWGRPDQQLPDTPWSILVLRGGRGSGKTRAGAEAARELARRMPGKLGAFIAPTPADARDYMIEGVSGIMAISPPSEKPTYEASKKLLTWPNGSTALVRTAAEPEAIRGPNFAWGWLDEFAKWRFLKQAWDNFRFALREGSDPKTLITTTPKPLPLIKEILAGRYPGTVVRAASMYRNLANLAPPFIEEMLAIYEGTRLGRQELGGEVLEDVEGALWLWEFFENRVDEAPELRRIVVGVDPSGTSSGAECGIIAAGATWDREGYVLEDRSARCSPAEWGRRSVELYHDLKADAIVAEVNFGADMVERVIRTTPGGEDVRFKAVRASRGKAQRAEPVVGLYENSRIHHVGTFPDLETELTSWVPGEKYSSAQSPGRLDALVFAITELMLPGVRKATTATAARRSLPMR